MKNECMHVSNKAHVRKRSEIDEPTSEASFNTVLYKYIYVSQYSKCSNIKLKNGDMSRFASSKEL